MKQLIFFFVLVICFYSTAQTDSLQCVKTKAMLEKLVTSINQFRNTINRTDNNRTCQKIDSILAKNSSCLKQYEISNLYMDLTENLTKDSTIPNKKIVIYFKKAILSGYSAAVVLNLKTGLYIKNNFPDKYKELEDLSDSMYVVSCNKFINANINLQVGFLLRYMIRKDQDVRTREMIARGNQKRNAILDSFVNEMNQVDSINEMLLTEIFEQYGYPGWSLVGSEGSSAELLLYHMTPDFQVKYIHLLYEAGQAKQVFLEERGFKALIDRTLLRCYNVSLYGLWQNTEPETDKAVINKYRRLLQLPEEK